MIRLTAAPLALLALAAGCSRGGAGGAPKHVPVAVARAEQRAVPYEILATGTVEPRQTVSVQAQVTGVLTSVAFREGDDVAIGQVLFQIDPRPFQAALQQAQAGLARDVAQATNAQLEANRYAELIKQDYVTKQDYEEKRATAEALAATVRADSATVANAELNLGWATVRASIAGRTGRMLVRPGNLVSSADPLVVINQIHPILVRFAVPGQSLGEIQRYRGNHLPLPVLVSASRQDTASSEGVLVFVDNNVDTATGTVLLKAEFANRDNALWPGEFVNARLQLYVDQKAVVVPSQAVMTGQQGTYVFLVDQSGTAQARPVTVARSSGGYAVVSQGVQAGDQVVIDGQLRLVPGAQVDVKSPVGGVPEPEADP